MSKVFNEEALRRDIVEEYGEYGAHAELLAEISRRLGAVEELDSETYNELCDTVTFFGTDNSWGPGEAAFLSVKACLEKV